MRFHWKIFAALVAAELSLIAAEPVAASEHRGAAMRRSMARSRTASSLPTSRWRKSRRCAPGSPIPQDRPTQFDGKFEIPTLDEVIDLAKRKSREKGRTVGIYPETKHPTYHQALGLSLEDRLLAALTRAGWNHRNAPVFIQSFEQGNLKALHKKTTVRLIQLVDADDVNADGTLAYSPPCDRPYDWTASGRGSTPSSAPSPTRTGPVRAKRRASWRRRPT